MAKVLDNSQTNMQTAEGSSLPPLPYADDAASQMPSYASIGFIVVIVLLLIIALFSVIKFSKKSKPSVQEKVTDIIGHSQETPKNSVPISNATKNESDSNTQKPSVKEEKSQQKISFATPNNIDKCIKKFLEITKNK
ncbi:hypothetical protein II906_12380 [bacterium]|nr:hypothetical protein [bacterium]